jgi:acyl-CoA dehydrogenase
VKLCTAKQAVAVCSEALECFGGAGYVEDTGLPMLLRDAQVFSIWEGTTNVLALDAMRVAASGSALAALHARMSALAQQVRDPALQAAMRASLAALASAQAWLREAVVKDPAGAEAGARRMAMALARALALALLAGHAQWALERGDGQPALAAQRFLAHGVGAIGVQPGGRTLAMDDPGGAG